MGDEWSNQRLADVVELIGGGTPKRNHSDYWGGDIPWLSVRDFNNDNRYVYSTEETITEKGVKNSSTKILSPGQIIISARGTVGALAQLVRPMAFNQSCYGINAKDGTFNDYLFYLLKHTVANLQRITHGAVFDTITRETFQHVEIALPSLPEQRAIAHILGSLDDKIELNRQMAQTLESIARAIFKSWFVDFDPVKAKMEGKQPEGMTEEIAALFPERLVDSELGMIPEG
uniref:restriction endonuclease subunit S n=1 Tax=Thiolapillus sp. TaxID=2017437 RepID=UPI003AF68A4B